MNTRLMVSASTIALGFAASVLATSASACGILAVSHWNTASAGAAVESAAMFPAAPQGDTGSKQQYRRYGSIVGLWKFTFAAQGNLGNMPPDGFVFDAGFQTWHADGTEIMNSGRPAATGDFCMGVWEREGNSYEMNHYAMAWNAPGTEPTDFAGIANIHEEVKLSQGGQAMSGTVTLDQYAPDGTTLVAHVAGTVSATRVTVF